VGPSIRGISDLSHRNFVFLELELDYVPNILQKLRSRATP
jgi:hypothetical protein